MEHKEILGTLNILNAKAIKTTEDLVEIERLEKRRDYCFEKGGNTKVSLRHFQPQFSS